MAVSNRHIFEQGATLGALGRVALSAIEQQLSGSRPSAGAPQVPGPTLEATYPPRSPQLVRDYIKHVGGDPAAYKGALPPHLFPQWGFGLGGQTLRGLPYPLARVLNGGCNLQINARIPADEPLHVRAFLESIDDDGKRAVLQQRVITSTKSAPDALVADMFAIVPLGGGASKGTTNGGGATNGKKPAKKPSPRVPDDARELSYFKLFRQGRPGFREAHGGFQSRALGPRLRACLWISKRHPPRFWHHGASHRRPQSRPVRRRRDADQVVDLSVHETTRAAGQGRSVHSGSGRLRGRCARRPGLPSRPFRDLSLTR